MGDTTDDLRSYDDTDYINRLISREPTVICGYHAQTSGRSGKSSAADLVVGALRQEIARLVADETSRFPSQPPPGSVLRWERQFKSTGNEIVYTYVALRVSDHWYLTGRRTVILTWDELVQKIGDSPCWIVTDYKEIPRPAPDPLESIDNPVDWYNAVYNGGVADHEDINDADGS